MTTLRQNQFSPFSNIVISKSTVIVAPGSPIDALAGNDRITGIANDATTAVPGGGVFGVYLQDQLSLSSGNDTLTGLATSPGGQGQLYGVVLGFNGITGSIDGGSGHDRITGVARSNPSGSQTQFQFGLALFSQSQILTGAGNDLIEGRASGVALRMDGIYMEAGSIIDTGSGNDRVIGTASNSFAIDATSGIFGDTTCRISTGDGHDQVIGTSTLAGNRWLGFLGGLTIDLGSGNDLLKGFGPCQAFGGSGKDIYDLRGYKTTDFEITKHNTGEVLFTGTFGNFSPTATLSDFEVFIFDNGIFSYNTLA